MLKNLQELPKLKDSISYLYADTHPNCRHDMLVARTGNQCDPCSDSGDL